jgi:serine/threonine-protein kinase RsbW
VYTAVLLASEAATNAIEHGNKLDTTRKVRISYIVQDGSVEMHFEDEGSGFNRADIPDPLSDENILDDGGRGIFLIERLADAVRYENGGRRVVIVLTRK